MTYEEFKIPSTRGDVELCCCRWVPDGDVKAVVQLSHGMMESVTGFDEFATFLNSNGIAAYGNDDLGHGMTTPDDRGIFAEKGGDDYVVNDLYEVTKVIEGEQPGIPIFLLGHSMGSFVIRRYATLYGDHLSGLIAIGTCQSPQWKLWVGKVVSRTIGIVKGPRYRSRYLDGAIMGKNNSWIENPVTPLDWMNRDAAMLKKFYKDPRRAKYFSVSAYHDMMTMLYRLGKEEGFENIPKDLPVILMSGDKDALSDFGKEVHTVSEKLAKHGITAEVRLYEDYRHDLIHELNREIVFEDILNWIEGRIGA